MLDILVRCGADVDAGGQDWTPLMFCAAKVWTSFFIFDLYLKFTLTLGNERCRASSMSLPC